MAVATKRKAHIGPVGKKIMLLLEAGIVLGLSGRPDAYFRLLHGAAEEWKRINSRSLHDAIRKLYTSKMIDFEENQDGSIAIRVSKKGKDISITRKMDHMQLPKFRTWDKKWRLVIFDIPEKFKDARKTLSMKLQEMGFYQMQKSVYVYPYECEDSIDFIIEILAIRRFVRYLVATEIDNELHLKHIFGIK